jgi:sodium/potassium-transporting ATPase subunit alpha
VSPDPDTMRRPPRPQRRRLIDLSLACRAYLFPGALEAAIVMGAFFFVLHQGGWQCGQVPSIRAPLYLRATTACLSAIVVLQIVNVFLCRSASRSIFSVGILGNRLIWGGVLLEMVLVLLIDYTRLGNFIFGTAPIGMQVWLFVLPFAVALLVAEELRKVFVRQETRPGIEATKGKAHSRHLSSGISMRTR